MNKHTIALAVALAVGVGVAQENYATGWSGHKNVIVNTSSIQGGANVSGNVLNFPLLVRLGTADSAVFAASQQNGADIRFTKANNTTRLSHQIEHWNATTRSAAIWVLMDTVYGNRNAQHIRMHWGNGTAADSSNGAQVFRTAHGFQAVWHMDGDSASSNEPDATANGLTATQSGSPAAVAGHIGGARNLVTGSETYFNVANSASTLNFAEYGNYTLSAWVNATSLVSHGVIMSKADNQYALKLNNGGFEWEFFEYDGIGWNAVTGFAEQGVWQHLVGVQNGFDAALYVNGVRVDFGIISTSGGDGRVTDTDLQIGRQSSPSTGRYFDGILDELRVANVSRSADWARLEFENQKTGATMVKLLDTVPTSIAPSLRATEHGFSVKATGNGLRFRLADEGASRARVTLVDMWGRTVWSRTADVRSSREIAWDGRNAAGHLVPQGVYAVRVTLVDAQNRTLRTLDRKVPLTR